MNIVWISFYPLVPNDHPSPWITTLAKEIVQSGHELTIFTLSSKISKVKKIDSGSGYEIIVIPYRGGLIQLLTFFKSRINALTNFINGYGKKIDIIHVHGTEHQFASSLENLSYQRPYISLCKKELSAKFSKYYLFWSLSSIYEKMEIRESKYFFCRTDWDRSFVKKLNGKAEVFECWEVLRPEFYNHKHGFNGKDIIFMGGDNPLKALDHCLQVFNELVKGKDIKLHIVGLADNISIRKMISAMNLNNITQNNMVLHGNLDAEGICKIYEDCFCLYHPSLIDNSPNSVCEAQVAGLPVIATNVGGLPSLIENGHTGILVSKNDLEEHLIALEKLYTDDDLKRDLSINAMKIAKERHHKGTIVKRTINVYQKLAQQSHV